MKSMTSTFTKLTSFTMLCSWPSEEFLRRCLLTLYHSLNILMSVNNLRRACSARVTVLGLGVCLSVCQQLFSHYRDYTSMNKEKSDFPETTALERYAVKTSEKANMYNCTSLPRPIRLLFVPCRGTRSHRKGSPVLPCYLIV